MSYTFGGSTTTSLGFAVPSAPFSTSRCCLFAGWFYPTTLTAGRKLWGMGATFGAEIDTTTSSIRLRSDNTTDGQWTFPAGLAVNTWTFVAVYFTGGSTNAVSWAAWTATRDGPVVDRAVTQATAPSGNIVSGGTTVVIGNSSGSLAFQGDIGGFTMAFDSGGARNINMLGTPGGATVPQYDIDMLRLYWVEPLFRGEIGRVAALRSYSFSGANNGLNLYVPLEGPSGALGLKLVNAPGGITAPTITGTVPASANVTPRTSATSADLRRRGTSMRRSVMRAA